MTLRYENDMKIYENYIKMIWKWYKNYMIMIWKWYENDMKMIWKWYENKENDMKMI